MGYFFVITTLLLSLTLTKTLADVSSLQDQDHLDPLQDQDQDLSTNNQDKRTICSALNKCGGGAAPTSGYYKRLVIRGGLKHHQLVGYRPVGLRPVVLGGYRYTKPKIQFRLKAPSAIRGEGWKPVPIAIKPVVEFRPSNHVDVVHNNPVPHVDHVTASPVHVDHVHVQPDHVHLQPAQPAFVHLRPVAAPTAHVDQVHQINVAHGNHYDTFTHLDHIQPSVAQPVLPVAPPPAVVRPVAPAPILFEVTRPNLGVLPLGAKFPSPVLRQVPHLHLNPVAPVAPIAPHPVQGIIHTPAVGLPAIAPQPGVSVEYHGTRNYLPLPGAVLAPGLNIPHQHLPQAFTPQQALPFEHAAHGFAVPLPHEHPTQFQSIPQQLPHEHPTQFLPVQQQFGAIPQQLPHEHPTQFLAAQQQLPHEHQAHFNNPYFQQQHLQSIQQYQDIPQGQLPLEGEQQQNFNHFHQSNQEPLNLQQFDESNVIQPGQTDLQIPYHLPQHGGWEGVQQVGLQEESRGFGEQVFRPSQQLEAPYTK